ncbi:Maestro heat-like repeat-containing protein family member 1 [Trichinella pseudospiralis]|uniref:Maestro heat-like repeat-containing protein family member 1 n=1 Tax=Trichinella pseudospiralis TaxID=6337 RepID=A0A0V1JL06_TRIPS|nr:Maestro heat-like repeat-containing protein family member 1 [Trichinella pseudospiralis]
MASLEDMINALFQSANDKHETVVEAVFTSLRTIGINQPERFLLLSHNFLSQQTKISFKHRELILKSMKYVCAENVASISNSTIALVINLSIQEITRLKESSDDWPITGSSILVVLSRNHCKSVVDCIMQKFQIGLPFCHFIISTLGEIALSNPVDFCPYLHKVLNRIIPMMGILKAESVRILSAEGIRKLGEAYLEFLDSGNSQSYSEIADPSALFVTIYDHVVSAWFSPRDNRVRCANLHLLGVLTNFLPLDRLREETSRLIRMIAPVHWKTNDPVPSIEGLCHIIQSTDKLGFQINDSAMDHLLLCMIYQVDAMSQVKNVSSLRYQGEVLRFFSYSTKQYQSRLCHILFDKLLSGQERMRCDVLLILKHLVNSKSLSLDYGRSILTTLMPFLTGDISSHVSVLMMNYIFYLLVALLESEYIALDRSEVYVRFMFCQLLQNSESDKLGKMNLVPMAQANKKSQFCQSIYYLISNVPSTEAVFWPLLFQYLCCKEFTDLLDEICKYLTVIAKRMNSTNRLTIIYPYGNERLPKSHFIFARLLVCLGTPFKRKVFNQNLLELLEQMASFFFPSLSTAWTEDIKLFHRRLAEENFKCDDRWQNQLAEFLIKTLNFVGNDKWIGALAAALREQFYLYYEREEAKRMCFMCFGITLSKLQSGVLVVDYLQALFVNTSHTSITEQTSLAEAVGYVAQGHVDIVLTKLENVTKREHVRRSSGVLGFIRDAIPLRPVLGNDMLSLRSTVLLCYGYVALHCPLDLLPMKLEHVIMRYLTSYFDNVEEEVIRRSLLITIKLIAEAVHPSRIAYEFPFRARLLHYVTEYIKFERPEVAYTDLRKLAIEAAIELSKLNPPLSDSNIYSVGTSFAGVVLPLEQVNSESEMQTLIADCLLQFNSWLLENLNRSMTIGQLVILLKLFLPWFVSTNAVHRERATECCRLLLKHFFDHVDLLLGQALSFPTFGCILAKFAPRTFDCSYKVRVASLDCIYWLFTIATVNLGHGRCYQDIVVDKLKRLTELLEFLLPDSQTRLMESLCELIEQRLPVEHMQQYMSVLTEMLTDDQASVSCAAATLLKSILINRGSMLTSEAETLFNTLLTKFTQQKMCLQTYAEALQAFCELGRHHLTVAVNRLLSESLPLSHAVCDCWRVLNRDSTMFAMVMDYLIEMITVEFDSDSDYSLTVCPIVPLSSVMATAAGVESNTVLLKYFPQLFATLMLQCGRIAGGVARQRGASANGASFRISPFITCGGIVVSTIRTLLVRARLDDVLFALTEADRWNDFDHSHHYPDAIYEVSKSIGMHYPEALPPIAAQLQEIASRNSSRCRLVMACVFSAFMKFCSSDDEQFAQTIFNGLMSSFSDQELLIRKMAVRGLGNMAHCDGKLFKYYSNLTVNSVIMGLDDSNDFKDEIAFEAMQGLSKLTAKCMPNQFAKVLTSVVLAIRPFFEKESGAIRSVAFNLLGNLSRFGRDSKFLEQVHSCMISVLLHLNDEVEDVCTAAAFALQEMLKLLNSEQLTDLSAKANQIGKEITYAEFLKEFTPVLVCFAEKLDFYALTCSSFFKSASLRMRCNAALFIGYFLGAVPDDLRNTISKESILSGLLINQINFALLHLIKKQTMTSVDVIDDDVNFSHSFLGLIILLKEPEVEVRRVAALTMSYLYAY